MGSLFSNSYFQIALWVVVGFILGIIMALLITGLANRTKSRRSRSTELRTKGRYQEIVRLWRDSGSGKIVTELRGKTFTNTASLSPKEYEYLARNSRDWATWLGISIAAASKDVPKPVEPEPAKNIDASRPSEEKQDIPVSQTMADSSLAQTMGESLPQAVAVTVAVEEISGEPLPPVLMESLAVEDVTPPVTPAVPAASPVLEAAPTAGARAKTAPAQVSIAEQVDQILQEKIAQLPPPAPVVLLKEDSREGVIVWINGVQYNGINSVKDENIKNLIRASVKEWERRNENK
jgi:hypothetical protein